MESEFCAMLHFLFPDELLFLYADADDAGLSGGSFGDQYLSLIHTDAADE